MLIILSAVLILSLIANAWLYRIYRARRIILSPHHEAILDAVVEFETKNHCLVDIQRINPENVYLRSPGR